MNGLTGSFFAAAVTVAAVAGAQDAPNQFRAGAAASNVTPWLGVSIAGHMNDRIATHVHDELHARCLVLDDGTTKIAFAIVDSCMVPREVVEDAKNRIQSATGIAPDHVLISATHTHSAACATPVFQSDPDPEYKKYLAVKVADGVRRAVNNLAPAKIAWGAGSVPDQVFNRRWKMKEGTIGPNPFGKVDKVQMNPPRASENLVEPAGPTDPEVPFVFVKGVDDRPIALLANYSLHYVGNDGGAVSADYFGMFAERIKQLLGARELDPPFIGAMTNGTSGNINNINFREASQSQPPYAQMKFVADKVAQNVFDAAQKLEWHDRVTLDAATQELQLGVRKPSPEELAEAKEIVRKAEGREMKTLPEIYARESVLIADYPDTVPVTIQALRIGDLGIAAVPCEVFVEIGLDIKANSALKPAFTIELANGYNGYLPTAAHHELGGYETWRARSSYLEVGAADKIQATALELLAQLKGSAQ
ncbi:MAG: neutral/alkaline non-lysosomal ceramidase N-terminal domain-containing protein [Candidatus Hydrogenedentes bacterium]|nr:neutral/alkaline non-lysosomal ceramidase N-terminal domain-containing protein [Candidatus Hydrogenedentota bacterium]